MDFSDGATTQPVSSPIMVDGLNWSDVIRAISTNYKKLDWARDLYRNLVNSAAGPAYECNSKEPPTPINKMAQFLEAYTALTVPDNPQCQINPTLRSLRVFGGTYQRSLNNLAKEIRLRDSARECITDAYYLAGCMKLHREKWKKQKLYDLDIDPGIPSATCIPPYDLAYDTTAKRESQMKWSADKYRVPFSHLQAGVDAGVYDAELVKQLRPTSKKDGEEKSMGVGSLGSTDDDEIEPMIDMADVWIESTDRVYYCIVEDPREFKLKNMKPLGSHEHRNSDHGPHYILGFFHYPHKVMPISPASRIDPLNRAINANLDKEIDSVSNYKQNLIYSSQGESTAQKLQKAKHLQPLLGDPRELTVITSGGSDPNCAQAIVRWFEYLNDANGNINTIAGLGTSAETLGQEQLIANAANKKVSALQSAVAAWLGEIFKGLGFMLFEDEFHTFVNQITVAGYTSDQDQWRPYEREGNFSDFNFEITATDLKINPPAMQAELLMSVVERVFAPLVQLIVQQGGTMDMAELAEELGRLLNMPVFERIIRFANAPQTEEETPSISVKGPPKDYNYTHDRPPNPGTMQQRLQATVDGMQPTQGAPTMAPAA